MIRLHIKGENIDLQLNSNNYKSHMTSLPTIYDNFVLGRTKMNVLSEIDIDKSKGDKVYSDILDRSSNLPNRLIIIRERIGHFIYPIGEFPSWVGLEIARDKREGKYLNDIIYEAIDLDKVSSMEITYHAD